MILRCIGFRLVIDHWQPHLRMHTEATLHKFMPQTTLVNTLQQTRAQGCVHLYGYIDGYIDDGPGYVVDLHRNATPQTTLRPYRTLRFSFGSATFDFQSLGRRGLRSCQPCSQYTERGAGYVVESCAIAKLD